MGRGVGVTDGRSESYIEESMQQEIYTNVNSGYHQGGAQYRNTSNHFSFSLLFSDFFYNQ